MKKGLYKKYMTLVLAAAMLVSTAGCGNKDGQGGNSKKETKELVYEGTELALEGIEGDSSSFFVQDDRIYITTYEWIEGEKSSSGGESTEGEETREDEDVTTEEETTEGEDATAEEETTEGEDAAAEEETTEGEDATAEEETTEGEDDATEEDTTGDEGEKDEGYSITRMYSCNLDGSDVKEISMPELDEDTYIYYTVVNKDDTLTHIISSWDEGTQKSTYCLMKTDAQGKELMNQNITDALKLSEYNYIAKLMTDDKNRLIIGMDRGVTILDEDGKFLFELESDSNYFEGAAKTKDGQIICGASSEEGACVQIIDIDNQKWGEKIKLDLNYFGNSDSLMDGAEYDFYYRDDSGIYGYDMASGKGIQIMDYMASNLSSDRTYGIVPIGKDQMLGMEYTEEGSQLVRYVKVDPSTIKDKQIITVGGLWIDESIKNEAVAFNKESDTYQIQFQSYEEEEDPLAKFNADIAAGNIPDILVLNNVPVNQYVAKGMLEDLTPYYEQDSEVNVEDILDPVREAMKIDDKYYYIATGFGLYTLVARTSDVGDATGWTYKDLLDLLEEKGEGVRPFYSQNKSSMMYTLTGRNIEDFVDWNTGKCSFDSQEFKDILELCNTGTNEEDEYDEDTPSEPLLIREGKMLFMEGGWINLGDIGVYSKIFEDDINFIGYPSADKSGNYFNLICQMGMYSKSQFKEGAWEFLRRFMTKEYQATKTYDTPVRKDCFEMKVREVTTTENYTDEFGREIWPYHSGWGWDGFDVDLGPLSDEELNMYKGLLNNTKKVVSYNSALNDIVIEEAKAYFAGDKSLEETVGIIQNRAETYVNENR